MEFWRLKGGRERCWGKKLVGMKGICHIWGGGYRDVDVDVDVDRDRDGGGDVDVDVDV